MEHYAGIDVSLELSSVCVVDAKGKVIKEAKVGSDPDSLVAFFRRLGFAIDRIGLEAGPLSQWLHAGLTQAGLETALLETRHVKAALSAMTVKTDRKDACGIAQLMRMGWFRPVHCKSVGSQEIRALLVGRKLLLGKLLDVEFSIRGILRGFGLEDGHGDAQELRGAGSGALRRPADAGTDRRGNAGCSRCAADGVCEVAQGDVVDRAQGRGLSPTYDHARR